MDHPSTLPGLLHCRFNAIHRRASGTPHGDSDGKIDLRKRRVHLPGDKKRRETRESKWRARSFPPSPPSLSPPPDRTTRTDLMIATPFHVPRLFHRISNQPFRTVFRTVPAASPLPITPLPPNDFPPRWIPFPLSIGRETGNEEGRHIIWQALTRARERRIEDPNSLIHDRVGPRKPIKPGKYLVWRREEDGSEEEEEEGALAGP